jgi:glycosyltransferase involved in cell wall biosynthesis
MSMSILFVTAMYPHPEQPGSGVFVMHQAQQLRSLGHRVDVVHVKGYQSRWNYLKGVRDVLLATWRTRYDVVHVHYGLTGLCALLRWRTPMVVTLHGSDILQGRLQPLISSFVSKRADATIAVSADIAARCPGWVIPCGVDLERFKPIDRDRARRQLGLASTGQYVLFPFNPERRLKRYDIADGAVQVLRERGSDVSLLPVWNAANDMMPLYYSAANMMVLCSDTEGSPTSVKEALACNLPVVSTDVGDVRTLLQGVDGAELCEQSIPAVAQALERASRRNERGGFDGRSAMGRYDQAMTMQRILTVYGTVLRRATRITTPGNSG